jgi:quercetin dioxygenase-like cupin family protein
MSALIDVAELPVVERKPGWRGRYFDSASMTFAYYLIDAGSSLHAHSHPQEEVWHVLEGQLEITIEGKISLAGSGTVAIVPPNASHAVRALIESAAIVVDHPRREGFA